MNAKQRELIERARNLTGRTDNICHAVTDLLNAALEIPDRAKLEWQYTGPDGGWDSINPRRYHVWCNEYGMFMWNLHDGISLDIGGFDTREKCFAACQRHADEQNDTLVKVKDKINKMVSPYWAAEYVNGFKTAKEQASSIIDEVRKEQSCKPE